MAQCAGQVKKVSLELGGNAPFLVFDDCDLDAAIAGAMMCKFRNSGQTCITANRMYVQDSIHDEFVERFAAAISQLAVGAGTSGGVNVGPLIDGDALAKVERHVVDAREQGAELLVGGARHELGGTFFQPTLLTGIRAGMAMTIEETFGPVAGITRFSDEREGIDLANNTPYGLAAFFYSRDIGRIWRVSEGLETGIVGINTGFISNEVSPFGGVKESGIGREGSKYGLEEWLEVKYLCMGGI
jgi:succinate-semialdehyde dehydrogenase/glutarate-semialdehyde dehydrogenase